MSRKRRNSGDLSSAGRCGFAGGLVAYAFVLQFVTRNLGSIDGYFHIRYSQLLRQAGWRNFPIEFPWLPLTILKPDRYFDHHMLFHAWLVPFAGDHLLIGAKVAAALAAATAFLAIYSFFLWHPVRRPEWWTIFTLAALPGFLYRLEMPRVQAWSLVFLLLALALLRRRKYVWLLPLACAYTWLYDGFPLLLAMCCCATLADWVLEREFRWQPLSYALGGVTVGLFLNPYFPNDFRFIADHFLGKLSLDEAVPVGAEWYPPAIAQWLGWAAPIGLLSGVGALLYQHRKQLNSFALSSLFIAWFFFLLTWKSERFVEYCVPFVGIALATALHDLTDQLVRRMRRVTRQRLAAALLIWLAASTIAAAVQLCRRPDAGRYARASQWIRGHTPAGSLVFNSDWDDFPFLYFHNPANHYVSGLDPTYLLRNNADLYLRWARIADGREVLPAQAIKHFFGASVAITDRRHEDFIAAMDRDPSGRRVYADTECVVYSIVSESPGGGSMSGTRRPAMAHAMEAQP